MKDQIVIVQSIKNPRITRRMTLWSAQLNKANWKLLDTYISESPKIIGVVKMCICTAVWQRPQVFKMFAKGIKALQCEGLELTVIVSGSEGSTSRKMVESEGFVYIEVPNNPLSAKHNAAIRKAREFNPHCVMLTGSDDVISTEALNIYLEKIREGYDFIGVTDFYFLDTITNKLAYWGGYTDRLRRGHTCGAFRLFSARVMNNWAWQPFEVRHSRILDDSIQNKLKQSHNIKTFTFSLKQRNVYALDIKSDVNMTPFQLWENTRYIDDNNLKDKFQYLWT